jgi:hypothetical protein
VQQGAGSYHQGGHEHQMRRKGSPMKTIECRMRLIVLSLALFVICGRNTAASANVAEKASNGKYEVTFLEDRPNTELGYSNDYVFQIRALATAQTSEFVLSHVGYPIEEMCLDAGFISGDRLLLLTRYAGRPDSHTVITIVSLPEAKSLDTIVCRAPALSPGKRFLIYEKGCLTHGPERYQSIVVLAYDLELSPADNRLSTAGENPYAVGVPVYPEAYAKEGLFYREEEQRPDNPFFHRVDSPFLWTEDASGVVFLCSHSKRTHLVQVNLRTGPGKAVICEQQVEITQDMIEPHRWMAFLSERDLGRDSIHILCSKTIAWQDSAHVVVTPNNAGPFFREEIVLPVPHCAE